MDGTTFFNSTIAIIQKIVLTVGIAYIAIGGYNFFQGFQNQDGTAKHNGINTVIAGGGIILLSALIATITL